MDGRPVSELTRRRRAVPRLRRQPGPLPRSWAWAAGVGWPLLLVVMTVAAPEPADPNAVPTLVDSAASLALMVGLFGTIAAAVIRQAKALVWSTGLGVVWVTTTIACPLSGHHDTMGWQWYTELTSSSSLLLLSLTGILVLRTPSLLPRLTRMHEGIDRR
jgi:hypothetical protein